MDRYQTDPNRTDGRSSLNLNLSVNLTLTPMPNPNPDLNTNPNPTPNTDLHALFDSCRDSGLQLGGHGTLRLDPSKEELEL